MKRLISISIFTIVTACIATASAQDNGTDIGSGGNGGSAVNSQRLAVSSSRISERVVLAQEAVNSAQIQLIAERIGTATDVSNTHRLILSISQMGEIYGTEASFLLDESMGLESARLISPGVVQIVYNDADSFYDDQNFTVTRTIDVRQALQDLNNATCDEGAICQVNTSVQLN